MALDFPSGPTIGQAYSGYIYDGEKWVSQGATPNAVRYDLPQGLTANQTAQARANIWVTKRNYVINGGMQISQENGTTAGGNIFYPVDMFVSNFATGGVPAVAQVAVKTPGGSPNRFRYGVSTIDAVVDAGDIVQIIHKIEGLRIADLNSGTLQAKQVTLQFGVKAPAGTYCVTFVNGATGNRYYVAEYVIAAGEANTDVVKTITLTLDTAGTWVSDNTSALELRWNLMGGSTYQTATPNQWTGGTVKFVTANQSNFMTSTSNVFELFDVSLTEGNVAPPFQVPDYASELALCQRYYWKKQATGNEYLSTLQAFATNQAAGGLVTFPTTMRTTPTVSQSSGTHFGCITSNGGASATMNTMTYVASTNSCSITVVTATANLVAGNATAFQFNNVAGYLTFTARL